MRFPASQPAHSVSWLAPSSKALTSWAADSSCRRLKLRWEKSNSGVVKIVKPKPGSSATWGASRPSGIDLGCGANSGLSAGTRSNVARVLFISASNSANKNSLMVIGSPIPIRTASWDACKTASEPLCTSQAGYESPLPPRCRSRSARWARRPAQYSSSGTARTIRW